MPSSTLNDRIKAWEILQGNLKPEIDEVPHLATDLAQLERLLTSGKALEDARQQHLRTGAARGRERKMVIEEGDGIFKRLTLALRAQFGPKSEQLYKYGVTPEKPRRRKAASATANPEAQKKALGQASAALKHPQ